MMKAPTLNYKMSQRAVMPNPLLSVDDVAKALRVSKARVARLLTIVEQSKSRRSKARKLYAAKKAAKKR